jgi:hypothetical protein
MSAHNSEEWVLNSSEAVLQLRGILVNFHPNFAWSPWKQPQTTLIKIQY